MRRLARLNFALVLLGLTAFSLAIAGCLPNGNERYGVNSPIRTQERSDNQNDDENQQSQVMPVESATEHREQTSPPVTSRPRSPEVFERDIYGAWVMCQGFVKGRLKAPSQASFGSIFGDYQSPEDVVRMTGNGKYRVRAWVEAPNSFGVMLRQSFVCELHEAGNDRWVLDSLIMEEDLSN